MTGVQCLHIETFKIHTITLRYKVYETEWLVTWVYKMQTIECASWFYTFWISQLDSHLRRFLGLGFSKNLSWLWSPLQLADDSQTGRHEHLLSTGETCVAGGDHRVPTPWQQLHFSLYFFYKRTKISTLLISIKVYFSSILDFLVTSLVMWI